MHGVKISPSESRKVVLIVDDDSSDIRFTQRVFTMVCPQIHTQGLGSGEELIAYLQGGKAFSDRNEFPYPVAILLDLRMPRMNGFEVLGWLRNHPPHNLLPAIVLTATGEVTVAQQAYALGARSFLNKPIKPAELTDMVATLGLGGHQGGGSYSLQAGSPSPVG